MSFSFQQLTSWLKSIFPSHEGRVLNNVKEWLENEIEDSQEFVDAKENAEDWVIATGTTSTVRDFVKMSFAEVGIELEFKGKGLDEKAFVAKCNNEDYQIQLGKEVLSVDPNYFRPTEVDLLIGDPSKANEILGWKHKYDLKKMVVEMVKSDVKLFEKEEFLKSNGFEINNYFD